MGWITMWQLLPWLDFSFYLSYWELLCLLDLQAFVEGLELEVLNKGFWQILNNKICKSASQVSILQPVRFKIF